MIKNGDIGEITSVSYVMLRPQKPCLLLAKCQKRKITYPGDTVRKRAAEGL